MSYAMDNRAAKGTALYTRKLVERLLDDDRFEWCLVHFERVDDPLYRRAREIVMPKLRLPAATRFVRTMLFFWKYRHEGFDIIHWFQPRLYPFFWLAPACHIVVTAHGAGDITAPGAFPLSRRIFNFILKHFNHTVDALIGVSEFGREEIIEYYRADPERTYAIYNGGGEDFHPILKSEAGRITSKYGIVQPFILDVSRLVPHKNVDAVIRAYDILRTDPSRREQLVIVGGPGYRHEETYALARRSPYASSILFIEYVPQEDLNALYAAAEVFVFPSLNEGFGLPVVEAFASGTPVVTSNVAALPEIAGSAALLVDPYKPDHIAGAIGRILSDQSLRASLVEKGRARAKQFTWKKTAEETLALYHSLAESIRWSGR